MPIYNDNNKDIISIYKNNVSQMKDKVENILCNMFHLLKWFHQTIVMFLLMELYTCRTGRYKKMWVSVTIRYGEEIHVGMPFLNIWIWYVQWRGFCIFKPGEAAEQCLTSLLHLYYCLVFLLHNFLTLVKRCLTATMSKTGFLMCQEW